MARHTKLFVGPYADWEGAVRGFTGDDPRLDELLDGGALDWNSGYAGWSRGRDCCMPLQLRPGCPRWPMAQESKSGNLLPGGMDCVTDWTGLDRGAEIAWFSAAFAGELDLIAEVVGHLPQFRWGLVVWDLS